MKENYRAWDIDIDTLSTPRDFIKAGVLAPSSHNSQPWLFRVLDENTISVSIDPKRRLLESDKNDRQAIISIGCAITNIEILADYHGYSCMIENDHDETLAILHFSKKGNGHQGDTKHLANFISKRVTNRTPHENKSLDEETVRTILSFASSTLRIDIITDHSLVQKLGTVAIDAGIAALEDSGFRHELSAYLKPNSTKSYIGMPGFGFGFPAPLSFLAPIFIWLFNMEKPARKQNVDLFKKTTGMLILSTLSDTQKDWLLVGRTYEHIALLATQAGMSTAPWAGTIQIGEHYREVQKILNITERPQFFARIGFPTKQTSHSPRLTAEQVTI